MPNSDNEGSGTTTSVLAPAVEKLLRPLIGLLMEHGLTYTWLSGLLKSIYVDVAEKEFKLAGKAQTDSRITLLTGVHRKDVRRLRGTPLVDVPPPETVYLGAQLVARWTGEKRFLDKAGRPKPLPRLSTGKKSVDFEELVTSVSKDIRPRAVLDEWLRLGVVDIDEKDRVYLVEEAFIPIKGFEEKVFYLGRNIHDHLAAARHNVQGRTPSFLERSVYYDDLTAQSVDALAELSEQEAMRVLKAINSAAMKLQRKDSSSLSATRRMNFGVYFFNEVEEPESSKKK